MRIESRTYLVAVVEVDKEDRILCQADGCGHSVYKRIHVVHDSGTIKVVGSECFKRVYAGLDSLAKTPQYGSSEGRILSKDERLALVENTERLIAKLEAEHLEAERLRAAQQEALRLEAERQAAEQVRQTMSHILSRKAANQAFRRRPVNFEGARVVADFASGVAESELAELRIKAKERLSIQHPGINLDSPGFVGLVNLEVRQMLRSKDNRMYVWKMDDCDFVAAETLEAAAKWYGELVGPPIDGEREIEECDLSTTMRSTFGPDGESFTFADQIEKMKAAGEAFPAVIAMDSHYS